MAQSAIPYPNGMNPVPVSVSQIAPDNSTMHIPIDSALSASVMIPGKRKRDDHDPATIDTATASDGSNANTMAATTGIGAPNTAAARTTTDKAEFIDACFQLIKKHDALNLLQNPIHVASDYAPSDEPALKRQKSEAPGTPSASVSDKMARQEYMSLEELTEDVCTIVDTRIKDLEASMAHEASSEKRKAIHQAYRLREETVAILHREYAYPYVPRLDAPKLVASSKARTILSVSTDAPQRQLFSSLSKDPDFEFDDQLLPENFRKLGLPDGLSASQIHYASRVMEDRRPGTIGDVFPRSKKFIPLPMPQKITPARGNVLVPQMPDAFEGAPYVSNYYFIQNLPTGHFLNYSNTGPSLAVTPELQKSSNPEDPSVAEMETMFRSAFSSFAPCRDDSTALVPSSFVGRMWWNRVGCDEFNNMVDSYLEGDKKAESEDHPMSDDIDLSVIDKALENGDEKMLDPSLEDIMKPKKKDPKEQEVEELLEEVSDLILTLASYQRLRNSAAPKNPAEAQAPDALTIAESAVPTEAEAHTYEALKAQLSLIISMLPPYAVSKLKGDQLEDLMISTKISQYSTPRGGSVSGQQMQYYGGRPPTTQQTPVPVPRQGSVQHIPSPVPQHRSATMSPVPPQQAQQMPQAYRQQPQPQAFSPYANQLAKTQTPYGHQAMPQFANAGPRPPQQPPAGYSADSPNARFRQPSFSQPGFHPQQQVPPSQQQQPQPQPQQQYYPNGVAPPRTASPQIPPGHVQPPPQYAPNQYATQQQQQQRFAPTPGAPNMPPASPQTTRQYMMQQPSQQPHPHPHHQRPGPGPGISSVPSPSPGPAPSTPSSIGSGQGSNGVYHGLPPDAAQAQQHRMYDQTKARMAITASTAGTNVPTPQSISQMQQQPAKHAQTLPQTPGSGLGQTHGMPPRAVANGSAPVIPHKVTPVPVPMIPGQGPKS
ncbi:hypothetical protein CFIMG_002281RA [Ceratocystis fimbriata CBS 114723]|uniref:Uncharacterized protein n=1 Tax=Ceratocystis fimbriata CBS 114723 TaxID=1035309 RepID=A0A2C5X3J9_9PEZI|nr:hypothetical protein CFIMG_002281RA [Ceratocystis fimbriata CBS 114723]